MHRFVVISRLLISLALVVVFAGMASAQDRRQNAAGEFDFYVLALSWSPSFCEAAAERGNSGRSQVQCERPYSFVVHGLWPQYERGFPEYCQRPSPRLDRNIMTSMLDLMPAPGLPPRRGGDAAGAGRLKILFRHAEATYQRMAARPAQTAESCLRSRSSTALLSSARHVDGRVPSTPKLRRGFGLLGAFAKRD